MLFKAEAITAYAGYGKSTLIGQQARKGDLVIAMTHLSVQNLKKKCRKDVDVHSIEFASTYWNKKINNLWIDEATMCDLLTIISIFKNSINKIRLYGDEN